MDMNTAAAATQGKNGLGMAGAEGPEHHEESMGITVDEDRG